MGDTGIIENVYEELCSYENLETAFNRARRGKTLKDYVIEFEAKLKENLLQLRTELLLQTYQPQPLKTFILRDPKTRKISKSAFRDRVIHHAICNIIEPVFDKRFIHDSFANRLGKGSLNAIKRFDVFKRKVSKNNTIRCYVLKAKGEIKILVIDKEGKIISSATANKVVNLGIEAMLKHINGTYTSLINYFKIGTGTAATLETSRMATKSL